MPREIYLHGDRLRLDPTKMLGQGGEADVYDISDLNPGGPKRALKLWKPEDHPDYQGDNDEAKRNREGARRRLTEYARKLTLFPRNVPPKVVPPEETVTTRSGSVVGYTMKLIEGAAALRQFAQKSFRRDGGIENDAVVKIFQDLHATVSALHRGNVVIGDFNYMNVLVRGLDAYLIDADSMQFAGFQCRSFTSRFVDPLICEAKLTRLVQEKPHSSDTDWYAFALMLFECLMYTHPYGGVYEPKNATKQMPQDERPLHRISVFNKEVIYPVKATPLTWLPNQVSDFYGELLTKDRRGIFPPTMLEILLAHSQGKYVDPSKFIPAVMKLEVIRGAASSRRVVRISNGAFVAAGFQNGDLLTLRHENGAFIRENGLTVLTGNLSQDLKYRVWGAKTLIAFQGQLALFSEGEQPQQFAVDSYQGKRPVFESNARHFYWLSGGQLLRNDRLGPAFIGNVLQNQTLFWVGPSFGFGFYRAGGITVGFVFDAERAGINDTVKLPPIRGELVDAACYFSSNRAWFFTSTIENGELINRCTVIKPDGTVLATAHGRDGEDNWLGSIRGRCAATIPAKQGAVAHRLFVATDRGLVGIDENNGTLFEAARYPNTKDMVDTEARLFFDLNQGMHAITQHEVRLVKFPV